MTQEKITKKLNDHFGIHLIDSQGNILPISRLPITIGRGDQNEIKIQDETVSKDHARIFYHKSVQAVCIEDLGSQNGILINNRPTKINILEDGMQIRFGAISLTFRDTGFIPPD